MFMMVLSLKQNPPPTPTPQISQPAYAQLSWSRTLDDIINNKKQLRIIAHNRLTVCGSQSGNRFRSLPSQP